MFKCDEAHALQFRPHRCVRGGVLRAEHSCRLWPETFDLLPNSEPGGAGMGRAPEAATIRAALALAAGAMQAWAARPGQARAVPPGA